VLGFEQDLAGFGAFEKILCIFSIAPVGILEKLRGVFLLRNTHWTLVLAAPDAGPERPLWCLWCRCVEYTGRTGVSTVLSVRCAGVLATLSVHESGEHRTLRVRPVARVR